MARATVTPHELVIMSRGPWDADVRRHEYVAAHCTCGDWPIVWDLDALHRIGTLDQETGWTAVARRLQRDHDQHRIARERLHRVAVEGRDPRFY